MKKDIEIPSVVDVYMAIAKEYNTEFQCESKQPGGKLVRRYGVRPQSVANRRNQLAANRAWRIFWARQLLS